MNPCLPSFGFTQALLFSCCTGFFSDCSPHPPLSPLLRLSENAIICKLSGPDADPSCLDPNGPSHSPTNVLLCRVTNPCLAAHHQFQSQLTFHLLLPLRYCNSPHFVLLPRCPFSEPPAHYQARISTQPLFSFSLVPDAKYLEFRSQ